MLVSPSQEHFPFGPGKAGSLNWINVKDWSLADISPKSYFTFPDPLPVFAQWDPRWVGLFFTYFSNLAWKVDP